MNKIKIALLLSLALLLLTNCSTARRSVKMVENLKDIPSVASPISQLSAKTEMKLLKDGKDEDGGLGGTLKVVEGEGTILAVTVAGMYEVARVESLPGEFILINKWNKVYTPLRYSEIEMLEQVGLNYDMFEALLTNTIFTHEGRRGVEAVQDMKIKDEGGEIILTTKKNRRIQFRFFVQKSSGNLVRTEILYSGVKLVDCLYGDFKYIDGRNMPQSIEFVLGIDELSLKGSSLLIELSKIKTNSVSLKRTNLKNYQEVDIKTFYNTAKENF